MRREEIFETVREILAEVLNRPVEITPETRFEKDLEVDSLRAMEILAAVEDKFDITVPINVLNEIRTVGDLVKEIEKLMEGDHGHL